MEPLHSDGNSVDSGQRVFAMKTARKSSFCSGVKTIIKKKEEERISSIASSSRHQVRQFCWYLFIETFILFHSFFPFFWMLGWEVLNRRFVFLPGSFFSSVMTWSELSHGRSEKWVACPFGLCVLGRPVMDIFKRQKGKKKGKEERGKKKRKER